MFSRKDLLKNVKASQSNTVFHRALVKQTQDNLRQYKQRVEAMQAKSSSNPRSLTGKGGSFSNLYHPLPHPEFTDEFALCFETGSHSVALAGLNSLCGVDWAGTHKGPAASASQGLRLKACSTKANFLIGSKYGEFFLA